MTGRKCLGIMIIFSVAVAMETLPVFAEEVGPDGPLRLALSIYLDGTGRSLVTGYAENPEALSFLNSSEYTYENDTHQLYALTNALTRKDGEIWTVAFASPGKYEDYRVTLYLPSNFKVLNASSSPAVDHFFSASNDSLALDFEGYDVLNPSVIVDYQQPLDSVPPRNPPSPLVSPPSLMLVLAAGVAAAFIWLYRARPPQTKPLQARTSWGSSISSEDMDPAAKEPEMPDKAILSPNSQEDSEGDVISSPQSSHSHEDGPLFEQSMPEDKCIDDSNADADDAVCGEEMAAHEGDPFGNSSAAKIEISSEMAAVMETLTPRERAILQALIDRGGRSTQADLRYETRTPKSSLTGIIYSLERRKLVTKKEWGRTNVIELSEWFLSKKGQL